MAAKTTFSWSFRRRGFACVLRRRWVCSRVRVRRIPSGVFEAPSLRVLSNFGAAMSYNPLLYNYVRSRIYLYIYLLLVVVFGYFFKFCCLSFGFAMLPSLEVSYFVILYST